jgi:hypothetical protein
VGEKGLEMGGVNKVCSYKCCAGTLSFIIFHQNGNNKRRIKRRKEEKMKATRLEACNRSERGERERERERKKS